MRWLDMCGGVRECYVSKIQDNTTFPNPNHLPYLSPASVSRPMFNIHFLFLLSRLLHTNTLLASLTECVFLFDFCPSSVYFCFCLECAVQYAFTLVPDNANKALYLTNPK